MLHAAKDALTSRSAQMWVNHRIARYGRVQALRIDSRHKTLEASCLLDGEATPITVRVDAYVVEKVGDKSYLRATGFTCTRPWLQTMLNDLARRQRIELPSWAALAL